MTFKREKVLQSPSSCDLSGDFFPSTILLPDWILAAARSDAEAILARESTPSEPVKQLTLSWGSSGSPDWSRI